MPKTYTVKQIAEILGFSTNTVYKYLDEGKISSIRLGAEGRFRIPESELTKFLGAQPVDPQPLPISAPATPTRILHRYLLVIPLVAIILCLVFLAYRHLTSSRNMNQMLADSPVILNQKKLLSAKFVGSVQGTVILPDHTFSSYKIINAKLNSFSSGQQFTNIPTLEFPSQDTSSASTITDQSFPFTLKNGQATQAQTLDKAITLIQLTNGQTIALKLLEAQIIDGQIQGYFIGQTLRTGNIIAGEVDPATQEITQVSISAGAPKVSDTQTMVAHQVLSLNSDYPSSSIDTAQLDWPKPSYNSDLQTWSFDQSVSTSPNLPSSSSASTAIAYFDNHLIPSLNLVSSVPGILDISTISGGYKFTLNLRDTIDSDSIINHSITSSDLADSTVDSSTIIDYTITNNDIASNTLNTGQLSASLIFGGGQLIDLSAVDYTSVTPQGLILPNSSASPFNPSSGKGHLAFDTVNNRVIVFNGSSWSPVGSNLSLHSGSASTSTVTSSSGLELINSSELSLIRGCSNAQVLKWNIATHAWQCGDDAGSAGTGISTIKENNVSVVTSASSLDFTGPDFIITNAGGGQAGVAIDYTNGQAAGTAAKGFLTAADWNTFNSKQAVLWQKAEGALSPAYITDDLLIGAAATGSAKFSVISGSGNTAVGGTLTVAGTTALNGNTTLGDAATDAITFTGEVRGASPLTFEGSTNNDIYTIFAITDPTVSNKTITFPNASITVNAAADISGTTLASGVITSSLTTVGALASGSIATGFGAISTANNISTTGTGTITSAGAISGPTSVNTINGLIINTGALSGITTLSASGQITSTATTGTAPFVIASTTNIANLNASSLNGATFTSPGNIGGGTAGTGTFTSLTATGLTNAGVVTNAAGGALSSLAGSITTVLHGNASGAPSFSSVTGSDLSSGISISTTGNLTTTGTGTITSAGTFSANGDTTLGDAATDAITFTGEVRGASPLTFEGTTNNDIYTIFSITDPTVSNKTITFPNASITVNAAADISGTTLASGVVTSSLTTVGTLASGSIATGFGAISTANNISTTGTGTITSAGAISGPTSVNTINGLVINNGNVTVGADKLLVVTGGAGNPTNTNGALWYDTTANKYKVVESGTVKTLCNTTDLGCGSAGAGIATVKENGANIVTSALSANFSAGDFVITDETGGQAGVAIDYTNGQAAGTAAKGFLTAADWNTFNSKQAVLWQKAEGALSPAYITDDLLIGAAATGSAKFSVISGSGNTAVGGTLTVAGTTALNGNTTLGDAATDQVTVTGEVLGTTPLTFEGGTDNNIYTIFSITDPTVSNKTITFPNASITVNAAADISGTTLASGVVTSSLTTVGTLASGSIATGFGAISTANNISTTGTGTITSAGAISGPTSVNTINGLVINNGNVTVGADKLLVVTGGAGNPTNTNGALWYDTTANKYKVVESGTVKTLCNTTDLGCGSAGAGIATVKENGANIVTSALSANFSAGDFVITDETGGQAGVAIDYTNGQAAGTAAKGFLTAADWNTFNSKQAVLWQKAEGALSPAYITDDLLIGAAATGSAKFSVISGSGNTAVGGTLTVAGTTALNGNTTLGDAATDQVTVTGEVLGTTPLTFEGGTDNNIYTIFSITDPTVSNKTITFPNASITVNAAADISGTTLASGVVTSSLTTVGTLASGSIATGFGAISTANNISTTGTGTITSAGAISGPTSVNTINGLVINNGNVTVGADKLLVVTGGAGNPTNTNGALWYDTTANKYKVVESGTVKTLCNTTDLGCGSAGAGIATVKENGANIVTSALSANFSAGDFVITDETGGQAGVAIDYTNGQAAGTAAKGFLTAADWNTFNSKQAVLWQKAEGALSPAYITDDLLIGAAATGSAKFSVISGSGNTAVGGTLTVAGTTALNGNTTLGDAATDQVTVTGEVLGTTPLTFEGGTDNNIYTIFSITDPTVSNKTITFPNASITVNAAADISGTTLASGVVTSSLTTVGTLASGSIATGFGAISTANNISTTGTGTITSAGAISGPTSVNTINGLVINNGNVTVGADKLLVVTGGAGNPTNTNGALWYDTTANKYKVVESGTVKTLCNTTDLGCGSAGAGIATVKENGANIVTSALSANFSAGDFVITDETGGQAGVAIDYTNGQAAGTAAKGFLTAADWNTFNSKQAVLWQKAEGALSPAYITDDLLIGAAATGSAKFSVISGSGNTAVGGTLTVAGTTALNGNTTLGDAATDQVTVTGEVLGTTPLTFEGGTDNNIYTIFSITDPTVSNKTITFPNASITVNAAADISGTTLASGVVTSSLTTVGTLASGSIATGFGAISTANNISTTGTGTITSAGAISGPTSVNTINGLVINNGNVTVGADKLLVVTGGAGNPTNTNGALWYDTTANKYKVVESGTVKTLCNTTDLGCGSAGAGIATVKENGANIVTSALSANFSAGDFVITDETGGQAGVAIDYTNGQAAGTAAKGFLTAADWNTFNSKQAVLWQKAEGALSPAYITDDLLIGAAATGSAKFSVISGSGNTAVGGTLTVAGTTALNGNTTLGDAATDQVTVTGEVLGTTPLTFEGGTDNNIYTIFSITDPTVSNKTITFPNASITVNAAADISGTTLASGVVTSSLTTVGTLASGSIATGFGAISTANNISTTGTGTITSAGAISGPTSVNTINGLVINNGNVTVGADKLLVVTGGAGNPTNTNGALWYDTTANKYKVVESGTVKTLCNTTDLGCGSAGAGIATVKENGANIVTSALSANFSAGDFVITDETGGQAGVAIDYTNGQAAGTAAKGFLTAADWNTFNSKQAVLWQKAEGALSPAYITDDLLIGAAATGSAKFSVISGSGNTAVGGTLTVAGTTALNGNTTLGDAATDQVTVTGEVLGTTPLTFEGGTDNNIYTIFSITDPTVSNKTITFPNASITVNAAADISGTTLASGVVTSSLTTVGTLASGSIATGFGAISTANNISTTGTGTITSAGAISGPTSVNTINGLVINNGNVTVGADKLLVVTGGAGNPTNTNGALWYDTTANKYKVVESGTVKTLCNTTDLGCGSAGAGIATVKENGANIVTSALSANFSAGDFVITDETGGQAGVAIDYTNGQAAGTAAKGFLTAADWNTFNSKQAVLWQKAEGALSPAYITDDLLIGAAATGSAKFSVISGSGNTAVGGTLTVAGTTALNGNTTLGDAATDQVTVTGEVLGTTPLTFEGGTDNNIYTIFSITDPTVSNKTITFPNASITVNAAADISGTTLASGVVTSSLTTVGTLASGSIATGFGAISTANNISTTGTGTITSAGTFSANGDTTLGDAATDAITFTGEVRGASPLTFEGTTNNDIYTIFSITDPTVSNKTITFPNASITVNAAADISGTTLASGVVTSSLTTVGTLASGSIATGFGAISTANNISTTGTGTITSAGTFSANGDTTLGDAATDAITFTGEVRGASPLTFEGTTNNDIYTIFSITDPTVSNKTITFPNASITVNAAADISGTTLASGVVTSSLTTVGTLASGSIATGFGAISTANNISTTGTGTITSAGALAANGGITFDQATDTVGAHTLTGTIDANLNIITNIGSAGTDFTTSGALTISLDAAEASGALVVNNSTQANSILVTQDNGTAVFTIADVSGTAVEGLTVTGNTSGAAVTIAATSGSTNIPLTINSKGTGALTLDPTGAGSIVIGSADVTAITFTTDNNAATDLNFTGGATFNNGVTVTGALAANGGITFDHATDTVGAHTLSGTIDANTNIITNIGNAATDFDTSGGLTLASNLTLNAQSDIRFADSDSSNWVAFQAPAVIGTNYTWTLPETDYAGCFRSDGSGNMTIAACGDTQTQTFTTNSNYTVPSDGLMVIVEAWGGGGGGGGGTGGTLGAARSGGGGGGGGAYTTSTYATATFGIAGTNVPVTVGTGGTGSNGSTGGAAPSNGGFGNPTCLSATTNCAGTMYQQSFGGGGGQGVGTAGNGGGGGGGANSVGTTSGTAGTGGTGGGPLGAAANADNSGGGGAGGRTAAANPGVGGSGNYGGGGGGASSTAGANPSSAGGGSIQGGAAGGGGGTCTITTCNLRNGGAGGHAPGTSGGGGSAGAGAGGAGNPGNDGVGGGGDGGGGGANTNVNGGNGGGGGNGGARGGGGGGGGASAGTGTQTGGKGGNGGTGYLRTWTLRGTGADLAEFYATDDPDLAAGDVVSIDPNLRSGVKKTEKTYDQNAIGIISTKPGLTLGDIDSNGAKTVLVALAGRVPVKVSTENGIINPGDLLTPSSIPGVAMKATKAGIIIGQSLTKSDSEGPGYVVAFIKNSYAQGSKLVDLVPGLSPDNSIRKQQVLAYFISNKPQLENAVSVSEITTDRLSAGLEIITPVVVTDELTTRVISSPNGIPAITFDAAGNASFSGTLTADNIITNHILGIGTSASVSALFSDPTPTPAPSIDLRVLGELQVTGAIIASGDIRLLGRPTFNSDTGGYAIISTGADEVDVKFDREYAAVPIINATIANGNDIMSEQLLLTSNTRFIVTRQSTTGFVIKLFSPALQDTPFSWSAIAVSNPKTFTSQPSGLSDILITPTPIIATPSATVTPEVPISTPTTTPEATPSSSLQNSPQELN